MATEVYTNPLHPLVITSAPGAVLPIDANIPHLTVGQPPVPVALITFPQKAAVRLGALNLRVICTRVNPSGYTDLPITEKMTLYSDQVANALLYIEASTIGPDAILEVHHDFGGLILRSTGGIYLLQGAAPNNDWLLVGTLNYTTYDPGSQSLSQPGEVVQASPQPLVGIEL